jgi:hypothetical protein
MFDMPTLIVIGAGAGVDIGMPLGSKLTEEIARKLDISGQGFDDDPVSGDPDVRGALRRYAKMKQCDYDAYRAAGRLINKGVWASRSIDSFINSHSDNTKLAACAKLGIVHTILYYEKHSALWRIPGRNRFQDQGRVRASWLADLFNTLIEGIVVAKNLTEVFDNLCIINFNYDRCIEHFLYWALLEWSNREQWEIGQLFENRRLKVFHPYGVLGRLPWQQDNGLRVVEFGGSDKGDHIEWYADGIRTFHEKIEEGEELTAMRNEIDQARRIIFLGFHFHKQNIDLMKIDGVEGDVPTRVAYATVMERSEADVRKIDMRISGMLGRPGGAGVAIRTFNGDCKGLFREHQSSWIA